MSAFTLFRRANLKLIDHATPTELKRVGVHSERGEESIEYLLGLYAGPTCFTFGRSSEFGLLWRAYLADCDTVLAAQARADPTKGPSSRTASLYTSADSESRPSAWPPRATSKGPSPFDVCRHHGPVPSQ